MFFCASSTSSAPRCVLQFRHRLRCARNASSRPADLRFLRVLQANRLGGLGADLLALVLQPLDLGLRILDLGLGLFLAGDKAGTLVAPRLRPTAPARRCAAPARLRCWRNDAANCSSDASATLLSVSAALAASRCLAQTFQFRRQRGHLLPARPARALPIHSAARPAPRAFASPSRSWLGQAFDLEHDGLNLLAQQAGGILQRLELAFARGDGHFLLAQFGLRLLQAGLQFRLLAQQRAALAAGLLDELLADRASSACNSVIWFLRPRMDDGALPLPWPFR